MCQKSIDDHRRGWLIATATLGSGMALAPLSTLLAGMAPSERAKAAGAPVEVDISGLPPGQLLVVEWRSKPVWILRRTPAMLDALAAVEPHLSDPHSEVTQQPEVCRNATRAIHPEVLVVVGICTHLGCSPGAKFKPGIEEGMPPDWAGGFLCPCHGSTFDFAGRVFKNKPAPTNLEIPPHTYLSASRLRIGEESRG